MNCIEVENLLPDYLSDNLDGDSRSRVEGHLRRCDRCARELSGMRRMIAELGGLEKVSAPPDFLAKVRRKASYKRRLGRIFETLFVPFGWKIPLQLTAMAALGVLIFFMVPYQRQGDESGLYLRQAPAPQVAVKKEMPLEVASPEGVSPQQAHSGQILAQDQEQPLAEAPASQAALKKEMLLEAASPQQAPKGEMFAQDQIQPNAKAPAPQAAMKKEMHLEAASPESAPEAEMLAQEPKQLPAKAPESSASAIAERDEAQGTEAQGTGAAISSQVAIPVVLRVASAEQVVKAKSRHAPAFDSAPAADSPAAKPRKFSEARRLKAKRMAPDEAKKDIGALAESEPADEIATGGIEKEDAPTESSLRKGGLFKRASSRFSAIDGKKEQPASGQLESRLRLLMERFGAVEVREPGAEDEGPAGPRRLKIELSSENFQPFIDRLETLGVVENPPPPLPQPLPESVVLDLILLFE